MDELHSLKEGWSVRELRRQRDSMLYERVGLSENRDEVLALAKEGVIDERPSAQIRDPFVFEFLGLRPSPAFSENVALPDENPPVGILLCADKDAEVVRFATAGDESLFVSRYVLELPSEETLKRWLHEERARLEQELNSLPPRDRPAGNAVDEVGGEELEP